MSSRAPVRPWLRFNKHRNLSCRLANGLDLGACACLVHLACRNWNVPDKACRMATMGSYYRSARWLCWLLKRRSNRPNAKWRARHMEEERQREAQRRAREAALRQQSSTSLGNSGFGGGFGSGGFGSGGFVVDSHPDPPVHRAVHRIARPVRRHQARHLIRASHARIGDGERQASAGCNSDLRETVFHRLD